MKLEGYSRRVKIGVRRDRLLIATLALIRDIKNNDVNRYKDRKSLVKRMARNQRFIKRYGDEIFNIYSVKEHIEVLPKIELN